MKADIDTIMKAATLLDRRLGKCEELSTKERLEARNALMNMQGILACVQYRQKISRPTH